MFVDFPIIGPLMSRKDRKCKLIVIFLLSLSDSGASAGANNGSPFLHVTLSPASQPCLAFKRHAEKLFLKKRNRTMSRRFIPDERCLGGVQEIHADYVNMRRKLLTAKPQVPIIADLQPATSVLPGT